MKTLEEVIKDKATLTSAFEDIEIYSHPGFLHLNIDFDTYISFKDILFNDNKEMYDFLKPFERGSGKRCLMAKIFEFFFFAFS